MRTEKKTTRTRTLSDRELLALARANRGDDFLPEGEDPYREEDEEPTSPGNFEPEVFVDVHPKNDNGFSFTALLALVVVLFAGCADPTAPEPTPTPVTTTTKAATYRCPAFDTVTAVAGIAASQPSTSTACDNLLGAASNTLSVFSGQSMLGTIAGPVGVVSGAACTFTFELGRSDSVTEIVGAFNCPGTSTYCETVGKGTPITTTSSSATKYTVTVPAVQL